MKMEDQFEFLLSIMGAHIRRKCIQLETEREWDQISVEIWVHIFSQYL